MSLYTKLNNSKQILKLEILHIGLTFQIKVNMNERSVKSPKFIYLSHYKLFKYNFKLDQATELYYFNNKLLCSYWTVVW